MTQCPNHGPHARCEDCKRPDALPVVAAGPRRKGRSHYSAKATVCERGHRHPSKVEARVCAWVYEKARIESDRNTPLRVYRNVRLPLWSLPPTDAGIPHYCNVDFAFVNYRAQIYKLFDAKSGKRSRDWERGRAAVEATYGVNVEETDGMTVNRAAAPGGSYE